MIKFSLYKGAKLPVKGSDLAAGLDIHALNDTTIAPFSTRLLSTGVYLNELPTSVYLSIRSRSKLAYKYLLDVKAGVVDADYRGEIMVLLTNNSDKSYSFKAGDAIAQLIPEYYCLEEAEAVPFEEMSMGRGSDGINSEEERR